MSCSFVFSSSENIRPQHVTLPPFERVRTGRSWFVKFGHLFKLEMRLEWTTDTALALHAVLCIIKRLMFIRDRTFRTAVAILLRTTFPFGKSRTMLNPLTIVAVYCYFISGTFRTECFYTIRSTNWNNQFTFLVMHIYIHNINRIILTERNYI